MAKPIAAFVGLVLVCALILAATHNATRARIEHNRARQLTDSIQALVGTDDRLPPVRWREDVWRMCNGKALVRGSTLGYGGPLAWLAAVSMDNGPRRLLGLQITAHQETPGIADFLNRPQDPWLVGLRGRDAQGIDEVATITGATITSRALRSAARAALAHPGLDHTAQRCER